MVSLDDGLPSPWPDTMLDHIRHKGALTLPNLAVQNALIQAYADFVHARFPVLTLPELLRIVSWPDGSTGNISLLLYWSILYSAATYVESRHRLFTHRNLLLQTAGLPIVAGAASIGLLQLGCLNWGSFHSVWKGSTSKGCWNAELLLEGRAVAVIVLIDVQAMEKWHYESVHKKPRHCSSVSGRIVSWSDIRHTIEPYIWHPNIN